MHDSALGEALPQGVTEGASLPTALSLLTKTGRNRKGRPLSHFAGKMPAFSGENGTLSTSATLARRQSFCHFVTFPLKSNVVNLRNNRILFLAIVGEHPRVLPRAFNHTLMSYPVFLREHTSGSRGRTHGSAPTKNLKLTTLP